MFNDSATAEYDPPLDKWVICDLDGVLVPDRARAHYVTGPVKNWDLFHMAGLQEPANMAGEVLLWSLLRSIYTKLAIVTGRTEPYRAATERWVKDHYLYVHELHMRPEGDTSRSTEYKRRVLEGFRHRNRRILFAVDDNEDMIHLYRAYGITTLTYCQGADWTCYHNHNKG